MKITLEAWARAQFDPAPKLNTLRCWARDGKIIPPAIKVGRTYYVEPKAKHIDEIIHGTTSPILA